MSIKDKSKTYALKHWKQLRNSVKLDSTMFKLLLIDIGFFVTILLSYVLIYYYYIRNYLTINNLLAVANVASPPSMSGVDVVAVWNNFLFNMILMVILAVLIYISIISIYSALSHFVLTHNKFNLKLIKNFVVIYSILTLIYLSLIVLVFSSINNVMTSAIIMIILSIIYSYFMLIDYLTINDSGISKNIIKGLKHIIRLHHKILPLLTYIISASILLSIALILFKNYLGICIIAIYLSISISFVWLRRYLHGIIHE